VHICTQAGQNSADLGLGRSKQCIFAYLAYTAYLAYLALKQKNYINISRIPCIPSPQTKKLYK